MKLVGSTSSNLISSYHHDGNFMCFQPDNSGRKSRCVTNEQCCSGCLNPFLFYNVLIHNLHYPGVNQK